MDFLVFLYAIAEEHSEAEIVTAMLAKKTTQKK